MEDTIGNPETFHLGNYNLEVIKQQIIINEKDDKIITTTPVIGFFQTIIQFLKNINKNI